MKKMSARLVCEINFKLIKSNNNEEIFEWSVFVFVGHLTLFFFYFSSFYFAFISYDLIKSSLAKPFWLLAMAFCVVLCCLWSVCDFLFVFILAWLRKKYLYDGFYTFNNNLLIKCLSGNWFNKFLYQKSAERKTEEQKDVKTAILIKS